MKRQFILFISAPFIGIGFVWQMLAGSFQAGRLMATMWVHAEAIKTLEKQDNARQEAKAKGLH